MEADWHEGQDASLMTCLRVATRSRHERLEALPFVEALTSGALPLEAYLTQLRALAVVHGVLEETLARLADPHVRALWHEGLRKLPPLEEDLASLEPRAWGRHSPPLEVALRMAERVRVRGLEQPASLLGYLYVLEGSSRGAVILRGLVARALHLEEPVGLRYLGAGSADVDARWESFREAMNGLAVAPDVAAQIVAAGVEAFDGFLELFAGLQPLAPEEGQRPAALLNPEAGRHPLPEDEREVQASIAAGWRTWEEFPYYEERYGERGRRFTKSDGAWLATLVEREQGDLDRQVEWLAGVLAARGMPRLTMEQHLRHLHQALVEAVPEREETYRKLLESAAALERSRSRVLDPVAQAELVARFAARVQGTDWARKLPRAAVLIVAAVADEALGVVGALESLTEWLTDESRFPAVWTTAVRETIREARERAAAL